MKSVAKTKRTNYTCFYCEWSGALDNLKTHHLNNHSDKTYVCQKAGKFKCLLCEVMVDKMPLLRKHFQLNHENTNIKYQYIVGGNSSNNAHIEEYEIIEEVLDANTIKPDSTLLYQCQYCADSFTDLNGLKSHHHLLHSHLEFKYESSLEELKKYKCPKCGHTSNSYPAMRDHLRNHCKPYRCGYCDLTATYPNVITTHHVKEHPLLEPQVLEIKEAHKINSELRDNLLCLQNDGTYSRLKNNLKRQSTENSIDEQPPNKKQALITENLIKMEDIKQKAPESLVKKIANVAKKSTATPPKYNNVAKKSTTPRPPPKFVGFSFYGTKPPPFNQIKHLKTGIDVLGKKIPISVDEYSKIYNIFPKVTIKPLNYS